MAGTTNSSQTLWTVSGVLGLVSAGLSLLALVLSFVIVGFWASDLVLLVPAGLAAAGGALALKRAANVAPWLLVASLVVNWIMGLLNINVWGTVATIASGVAQVSLLVAAILAIVAMVKGRNSASAVAVDALPVSVGAGLAQPDASGAVPAGWYRDPDGKTSERYWDGSTWTEQSRPLTAMTANIGAAPGKVLVDQFGQPVSDRSRTAALLLCFFIGGLGIHRFYVGKVGTGIAMIFTLGGLGIWSLVDLIMIAVGSFKDMEGRRLINW